ncbi:MAG: hypothetical protein R6U50_08080 [Desulfobacterales bacterium]
MNTDRDAIIEVQCYAGYRAGQRPISFILHGRKRMIDVIIDYWRSPEYDYFKVAADDGNRYILKSRHDGEWVLDGIIPPP